MYEFGGGDPMSNADTTAIQKEQVGPRKKRTFKNDFGNLNEEKIMDSALGPNVYRQNSTSGRAKRRLRKILSEGGYKFGDMDEKTGGLDYHAIMLGGEPE